MSANQLQAIKQGAVGEFVDKLFLCNGCHVLDLFEYFQVIWY